MSGPTVNRMIPNVLTLLALCAGMTAIRFAILGKFEYAVGSIVLAAVLDALDGRVARLLKSTSNFGAQLDSFSDFISFGVAPAILLHIWTMAQWTSVGWAIALLFGVCMALRLARFNTQLGIADPPPYAYNFFTGVPAPAAAGLAMLPLCAAFEFGPAVFRSPWLNAVTLIGISLLMISRVPTFSFKRLRVPHDWVLPLMVTAALLAGFLATAPWPTLVVVGLVYLGSIPFSIRSYAKLKRAAEEIRAGSGLRAVEPVAEKNAPDAAE